MPTYIDHHAMPAFTPDVAEQMKSMIKSGARDPNGVKAINVYAGTDGTGFCHSEAANPEAVIKSHAAMGVKLERSQITEVTPVV